jgi:hypothetical protein
MIPICHPSLKPIDRILSGWWIIGKIIFIRVFDHPSSFVLLNVSLRFPTAYETQASESNEALSTKHTGGDRRTEQLQ